jgi:hypothetical protein
VFLSNSLEGLINTFHTILIAASLEREQPYNLAGYRFSTLQDAERHANILPEVKARPSIRQVLGHIALYSFHLSRFYGKVGSAALCQAWQASAWIPAMAPWAVHHESPITLVNIATRRRRHGVHPAPTALHIVSEVISRKKIAPALRVSSPDGVPLRIYKW